MNAATKTNEPPQSTALTPMEMLDRAVTSGASIETLEKLMALQERWEKNGARRAFDAAIAGAKSEIPIIAKTRKGHNDKKFADFAAIAAVVDPIISRHGLSYRFRTSQDALIHVTCILSHRDGHSEETTLAGPADDSGKKNAIQAIGSTLTYLQRYSLIQMLGLASSEDDDGGAAPAVDPLEEAKSIMDMIDATPSDSLSGLRDVVRKECEAQKISGAAFKLVQSHYAARMKRQVEMSDAD